MLNGNVNTLVGDIEALLKDICEFLGNNVNDGFSKEQKSLAEILINRSKSQLQTIAKISLDIPESDASYVDMTPKAPPKPVPKNISPAESYSTVELITRDCPYKSLSVSEAKHDNHWGYLERKKMVWFLEHQVRQFAIIVDRWLLIYTSEKDMRPIEFVDLELASVRYADPNDTKCKKQARCFELISPSKNYQFLAKNTKDMDQWITALRKTTTITLSQQNAVKENMEINKTNFTKSVRKELPPLPQVPSIPNPYMLNDGKKRESMENYDAVILSVVDENGENIYETPVLSPAAQNSIKVQEQSPPPLPPPLHTKPKYFLHSHNKSAQSPQLTTPPQSIEFDDDEEVDYDLPLNEKNEMERKLSMIHVKNVEVDDIDDSQEIYDEVITPLAKPEVKPNIHQLKSKIDAKGLIVRNQPKQKFAGINRNPSYLRDNSE